MCTVLTILSIIIEDRISKDSLESVQILPDNLRSSSSLWNHEIISQRDPNSVLDPSREDSHDSSVSLYPSFLLYISRISLTPRSFTLHVSLPCCLAPCFSIRFLRNWSLSNQSLPKTALSNQSLGAGPGWIGTSFGKLLGCRMGARCIARLLNIQSKIHFYVTLVKENKHVVVDLLLLSTTG